MNRWRLNIKDLDKIIDLVEKKWEEDPEGYKTSVWLNELSVTKSKLYQLWYQEKDKQEIIDGVHSLKNKKLTGKEILESNQKKVWTKEKKGWSNQNDIERPRGDEPIVFTFADPLDLDKCNSQAEALNLINGDDNV